MKRKSLLITSILLIGWAGAPIFSNPAWLKVVDNVGRFTNIAGFNSETHGIIAGYVGNVWYTNDAGKTWKKGINISQCRYGLDVLDDKTAVNAGNGSRVNVTTNGGANWSSLGDFGLCAPENCMFLSFLDIKTGWAGSSSVLASTEDGGAHWIPVSLPASIGKIAAIDLLGPGRGLILDTAGSLFSTSDGGASWSSKPVTVQGSRFEFMPGTCAVDALRFESLDKGLVVAYCSEPQKSWVALRTEDGGDTWSAEEITDTMDSASSLFVSKDGRFVTLYHAKEIAVFERK